MSSSQSQKYGQNFLSSDNGCSILSQSSSHPRGLPESILSNDEKAVWLTTEALPQECVISMRNAQRKPNFYNVVGIYCWHQYDSNPAVIEIWAKNTGQNEKWALVTKIRLALSDIWQYFKIEQLNAQKLKQLKIKITQNYGDTKTYLNKIGLFYLNPSLSRQQSMPNAPQHALSVPHNHTANSAKISLQNSPKQKQMQQKKQKQGQHRGKFYSEYEKAKNGMYNHVKGDHTIIGQLQKQLTKAKQSIDTFVQKQQIMEKNIERQNKIIQNMSSTLKSVVKIVNDLQKISKIQQIASSQPQSTDKNRQKIHNSTHQYGFGLQNESKTKKIREHKNYLTPSSHIQSEQIQELKRMLNSLQKQSYQKNSSKQRSVQPSQPRRTKQSEQAKHRGNKSSKPLYPYQNATDVIRTNSQQQLSQYDETGQNFQNFQLSMAKKHDYRSSMTNYPNQNQNSKDHSRGKGDKAKMLERLVKLIQLKQKKKLQLKKSGTKSRKSRKRQSLSLYDQNQNDYDQRDNYSSNQQQHL